MNYKFHPLIKLTNGNIPGMYLKIMTFHKMQNLLMVPVRPRIKLHVPVFFKSLKLIMWFDSQADLEKGGGGGPPLL